MNLLASLRAALPGAMVCIALAGCAEGPDNTGEPLEPAEGNSETAPIPETETIPDLPDLESNVTGKPTSSPAVPDLGAALSGQEETNEPDTVTDPEVGSATDSIPTENPFDVAVATDEPDDATPDSTDPMTGSTPDGGAADNGEGSAGREDANTSLSTHAPDGTPYCD